MKKNNFLLLSLDDERSQKIGSAVNNKTAKLILNYLSDKDSATSTQISNELNIPISSVQYNIEQLQKAGLVDWENYHISEKGKEVKHYFLANKYIIIAPKDDPNFLERLKSIIPSFLLMFFGTFLLFFKDKINFKLNGSTEMSNIMLDSIDEPQMMIARNIEPVMNDIVFENTTYSPSLWELVKYEPWFWFFCGAFLIILVDILFIYIKYKKNK